ncbi:MAG TPA: transcriptional repressor [Candidatus Butyricicoccus avicola]|nr:transcriptional repressor [Candidatus Butyricicoccus avicola]
MVQTKQRQLILEAVRATNSHPTADELFQMIRRKLPTISLATVYRNLNFLSEIGEIRKLAMPGMPDRFDWRMDPHDHMVCDTCGQVVDFVLPHDLGQEIASACGAQVDGYTLVAHGTCAHCRVKH